MFCRRDLIKGTMVFWHSIQTSGNTLHFPAKLFTTYSFISIATGCGEKWRMETRKSSKSIQLVIVQCIFASDILYCIVLYLNICIALLVGELFIGAASVQGPMRKNNFLRGKGRQKTA